MIHGERYAVRSVRIEVGPDKLSPKDRERVRSGRNGGADQTTPLLQSSACGSAPRRRRRGGGRRLKDPAIASPRHDEDETMTAVDVSFLFDTPPEPKFDRITTLAARLVGAPIVLLTLVDNRRQFFKSLYGLTGWAAEARGTSLDHSFCRHVVERDEVLEIEDARSHPVLCGNKAVVDLEVVAYLGMPIRRPDGRAIGSLCAIDRRPRRWGAAARETLEMIAGWVDTEIALRVALTRRTESLRELRAAHKALDQAPEIERALDERTRLFTALSHEIRTPLNGVLGGLTLMEAAGDETTRAKFETVVRESAAALTDFVDALLDYARASAGREADASAAFDPMAPAAAVRQALVGAASEKGLTLSLEAGDAPRSWIGDAGRAERILTALVGNAIKFADRGQVRLSIRVEDGRLVYRVADEGPGLAPEFRDQIFEPFDRGDPVLSMRKPGAGLGLALARMHARALGGALEAEPVADGASFRLSLPSG